MKKTIITCGICVIMLFMLWKVANGFLIINDTSPDKKLYGTWKLVSEEGKAAIPDWLLTTADYLGSATVVGFDEHYYTLYGTVFGIPVEQAKYRYTRSGKRLLIEGYSNVEYEINDNKLILYDHDSILYHEKYPLY